MKTYRELLENIDNSSIVPQGLMKVGISNSMDRYTIDYMTKFFDQLNSSLQPEIPTTMSYVENHLNRFGYTMEKLDLDDILDDKEGDEDFAIFEKATRSLVENVYISLHFEKMAAATQFNGRSDSGKLLLNVRFKMEEVAPGELEKMLNDLENYPEDDVDFQDKSDKNDGTDQSINTAIHNS